MLGTELIPVDGRVVLAVRGEIDMATAPQLEQLCRQFSGTAKQMVLDFSGVTFLDSSGINALLRATRTADASSITILNPSDQIVRTLRITGVADLFLAATVAETRR